MTNDKEIWKTYPEYPWIEVSNLGRVRTKDRYVQNGKNSKRLVKGRVLKQWVHRYGYMYVHFKVNNKTVNLKVHRMVATCFFPNPNSYPEVNHIDNNPSNNVVSNLEWCTREYNIAYREKYGVSAAEAVGCPVFAINPETSEVFWFKSQGEASRHLGVYQSSISRVTKAQRNKAGVCWFCDADENAVEKTRSKFGDGIAEKVEKLMRES